MKILYQLLALFQVVFLAVARAQGDEYSKDANVYELTPSNFEKVILNTNYTSIVKFYAPWCGYCQKLKPVYKKLGKLIHEDGKLAINVAAVNCDQEYNKPLCSKYKISGFPTLTVFRPPKYDPNSKSKVYKHATDTYNGERSLKSMYSHLTSHIKNYVKKFQSLKSDTTKNWFDQNESFNKVLLISSNSQISPLYKSLAIDFIDTHKFSMLTLKRIEEENPIITLSSGDEITIPLSKQDELPVLLSFDDENKVFNKYEPKLKSNDKVKIGEWLIDQNGVKPLEGELSKKEKKMYKYRTGKKAKPAHDEL